MITNKEVYISYCQDKVKALTETIKDLNEMDFYHSDPAGLARIQCLKDLKMEIERELD